MEDLAIKKAKGRRENETQQRKDDTLELSMCRTDFSKRDLETVLQESLKVFEENVKKMSVNSFENVKGIFFLSFTLSLKS